LASLGEGEAKGKGIGLRWKGGAVVEWWNAGRSHGCQAADPIIP
jgi:hypothetical protein